MKKKLVGSRFGLNLIRLRNWVALRTISFRNPEKAASVANAILADRLITRLCPSHGTFLDIGAHIGSVLSSVHLHDDSINIIAFEADPTKSSELQDKYDYCKVHPFAVGEGDGTVDFYVDPNLSGYNSLMENNRKGMRKIAVQLASLDSVLGETKVDVIKIDVEGAELGALRSGQKMIARDRPTIMFESAVAGENAMGFSPRALWEWFQSIDYDLVTPDRVAHTAPPLGVNSFLDSHCYPLRTHNYFAIPRERRSEIRDAARAAIGVKPTE